MAVLGFLTPFLSNRGSTSHFPRRQAGGSGGQAAGGTDYLSDVISLVMWVKSAFFKKPARKRRWLHFLSAKDAVHVKVPPEPGNTRWNSWFEAVQFHAEHVHLYKEFFSAEKSSAQAVKNILPSMSILPNRSTR